MGAKNQDLSKFNIDSYPRGEKAFVYMLTFPDGKRYIGKTKYSVRDRLYGHATGQGPLRVAISKCGTDAVKGEILAYESRDNVHQVERLMIKKHGTQHPNGYNVNGHRSRVEQPFVLDTNVFECPHCSKEITQYVTKAPRIRQ
jgi:hypothetical protein